MQRTLRFVTSVRIVMDVACALYMHSPGAVVICQDAAVCEVYTECCRSGIGYAAQYSCRQSWLLPMPTGLFGRRWSFPRFHVPRTGSFIPASRPSATPAAAPTTTTSGPGGSSGRSATFETPSTIKNPKPGHYQAAIVKGASTADQHPMQGGKTAEMADLALAEGGTRCLPLGLHAIDPLVLIHPGL